MYTRTNKTKLQISPGHMVVSPGKQVSRDFDGRPDPELLALSHVFAALGPGYNSLYIWGLGFQDKAVASFMMLCLFTDLMRGEYL